VRLSRLKLFFLAIGFAAALLAICSAARAQSPIETTPPEHKRTESQQRDQTAPLVDQQAQKYPTAAELSAKETPASAMLRTFEYEEYEFRSAAEGMPAEKYGYRPTQGDYGGDFPATARRVCAPLRSR
jgi:hypothetical protein